MWTLDNIMKLAKQHHASDIHLVHGLSPVFRIHGEIRNAKGDPLSRENLWAILREVATEKHVEAFEKNQRLCFSTAREGTGRFRVSVYFHALIPEMSIRICETRIRTLQELGLPQVIEDFTRFPYGLVLVTGPTGVGKTTTLNVMVDIINQEQRKKIVEQVFQVTGVKVSEVNDELQIVAPKAATKVPVQAAKSAVSAVTAPVPMPTKASPMVPTSAKQTQQASQRRDVPSPPPLEQFRWFRDSAFRQSR
jgi:type II secretory ATPase GspE/PulE/Tfp pilus assembly ATPase PilB-like protein